ncbi:gene transfer agent family protein [Rhodobacteraceae bacterium]|nr:gene transfer agent family protein [Paracoccaceae bacterium]
MVNHIRGEAAVWIGGRQLVMIMDFNAICDLEGATGRSVEDIFDDLDQGRVMARDLRAIAYALLQQRQPKMGLREVGELIGHHGAEVMDGVRATMNAAFPPADEAPGASGQVPGNGSAAQG